MTPDGRIEELESALKEAIWRLREIDTNLSQPKSDGSVTRARIIAHEPRGKLYAALDANSTEWLDDLEALAAESLADDAKADKRIDWDVEQIKRWIWG